MKRLTTALLLGLIMVVSCIYLFEMASTSIDVPTTDDKSPATAPGDLEEVQSGHPEDRSATLRDRQIQPGDGESRRRHRQVSTLTVTGRCLDAQTQAPIVGCEVGVAPTTKGEQTPVYGRTNASGEFAIQLEAPSSSTLRLQARAPGRADMEGTVVGKGRLRVAGDILMPLGISIVGRVEDQAGAPLPGIKLRLSRQTGPDKPALIHPMNWVNIESNPRGNFSTTTLLACQGWTLNSIEVGVRVVAPVKGIELTPGPTSQQLAVIVRLPNPESMIQGRLIDEDHNPIPQTIIRALDKAGTPMGFGYSTPDGSFTVRCRTESEAPVRLSVPEASGFEKLLTTDYIAWGSDAVELVMERTSGISILVVRSNDDSPVENYQVLWYQVYKLGERAPQQSRQPMAPHPEGKAVIAGIPRGPARLIIIPSDQSLAPSDPLDFINGEDLPEIRIELATRVSLEVEVINSDGQPVSGSTLDLLRSETGEPITETTRALDHRNYSQLAFRPQDKVIRLDRTKTDTTGLATLRWRPSSTRLSIRIVGPDHITMIQDGVVLAEDSARIRITVRVGARLVGQLHPLDVVKQMIQSSGSSKWRGLGPRIILTQQGLSQTSKGRIKTVAVRPDGTFEFKGLIPGGAELRLTATRLSRGRGVRIADKLLGTIELTGGDKPRKVNFDISDLRSARLAGTVFMNGAESRQTKIHLTRVNDSIEQHRSTSILLHTDDDGRFHSGAIGPGRYALAVVVPGQNRQPTKLTCSTIVELSPGGNITQTFYIRSGSLRIRVRNADGSAAANRDFWIIGKATQQAVLEQSDAQGRLSIEQISAGEYIVRTRQDLGASKSPRSSRVRFTKLRELTEVGRVTVTDRSNPATIDLKLPAK